MRGLGGLVCLAVLGASCANAKGAGGIPSHAKFKFNKDSGIISLFDDDNLRLNVKGGAMEEGDPVVLWTPGPQANELFDMKNGQVMVRSMPTLCLNAEGGANSGTNIVIFPCSHGGKVVEHEQFVMDKKGRLHMYKQAMASVPSLRSKMCINVKGGDMVMGAELVLWACNTKDDELNDVFDYEDGVIKSRSHPDLHFNIAGGVNPEAETPSKLVLWSMHAGTHEMFEFTNKGQIQLKSRAGMCLNAEGGLGAGQRIVVWPCSEQGEENELFTVDLERNVIFSTVKPELGFNVKAGQTASGGELILWQLDHTEL